VDIEISAPVLRQEVLHNRQIFIKITGMRNLFSPAKITLAIICAGLLAAGLPVKAGVVVNPALPVIPKGVFDIVKFGAVGDGEATNTTAIQAALDAANGAGGGTVEVPAGVFLSGPIHLYSGINLCLDKHAILRMLPIDKYPGGTAEPQRFGHDRRAGDALVAVCPGAWRAAAKDDRAGDVPSHPDRKGHADQFTDVSYRHQRTVNGCNGAECDHPRKSLDRSRQSRP
jgi:hypothetical protein